MNYEWIILILLIVFTIAIVFWTYFNFRSKQVFKVSAKKFCVKVLNQLLVENKIMLIPGNLDNDIQLNKKRIKDHMQLVKIISQTIKINFVNFVWLFLEKIVQKYTTNTEGERNVFFRDSNYGNENKNDALFKNIILNLISNLELQLFLLNKNNNKLDQISFEDYYNSLSEINQIVFVKFKINFGIQSYSFMIWPIGNVNLEVDDVLKILNSNQVVFINSEMLVKNYNQNVFQNEVLDSIEILETTYFLSSKKIENEIIDLIQTKKSKSINKVNSILLKLDLIQLEIVYKSMKQKMLLTIEANNKK